MQKDTFLQNVHRNLVEAFKTNNESVLKSIYQDNYYKTRSYVLQNNGNEQQSKDIYQEAFLAVWQNIKNGHFVPKTNTSLNGYLFTISKNKWINYLRSHNYKKMVSITDFENSKLASAESETIETHEENNDKLKKTMSAFNCLGDVCKTLLTKVYFEKKSMKEIAIELDLDAASTRNKKYRCMQKLRELALKK